MTPVPVTPVPVTPVPVTPVPAAAPEQSLLILAEDTNSAPLTESEKQHRPVSYREGAKKNKPRKARSH